jgi:hypothetical protein
LAIGFEQEWKQKFACSQGDLEVYCHEKINQIFDQESFEREVAFIASNEFCQKMFKYTLEFESEVLKEVINWFNSQILILLLSNY